ncbi:MAG: tRNA pseudouridine(55) synthase TruB [Anaerolineae bacterium]|nr:tRNA pseudouridine(55) synthase TruB [Anaerolineae bacterium]
MSGIVNVDKPSGMTSHDVVDAVRRMAGQRKVGHAGTLDPLASGVLLLCLGRATRVVEYLMAGRKSYRAAILLGRTTTTYDVEGEVVAAGGRADFGRAEIEAALAGFVGPIQQVPPVYSALKQRGQPLYKLARQGEEVEPSPRAVEIYSLELLSWAPPILTVEVTCSPGTYVRSLAHDLGRQLGSGACLAGLIRLRSGRFSLEEAVSLERLAEAFQHGQEAGYLLPMDEALLDLPALILAQSDAQRIIQGQSIAALQPPASNLQLSAECRAYSSSGDLVAILSYDPATSAWRPRKVFAA